MENDAHSPWYYLYAIRCTCRNYTCINSTLSSPLFHTQQEDQVFRLSSPICEVREKISRNVCQNPEEVKPYVRRKRCFSDDHWVALASTPNRATASRSRPMIPLR
ncbi:hypothetical protein PIB30_055672 [Stylosanthes scabra]|uniref:Uncharacterized protein n=1 Tax=Stylosanthes scabra TaxID=79078 RepID=A0ABU6ZHU1_9FABA|nr:hypothetical protein [Stylosanthes scabra]